MTWRERILNEFAVDVALITWVSDPDRLLTERFLQQALEEKGFELIQFEDAIALRFLLESKYLPQQASTELGNLLVIHAGSLEDFQSLPYDLIQEHQQVALSLQTLFPKLNYPVLKALNPADFDILDGTATHQSRKLGENATKDFLLRHVFEIMPDLIKEPVDLLEMLLKRHYQGISIPLILDKHLIKQLRKNPAFAQWPLEAIVPSQSAFMAFLQERWLPFVEQALVPNGKGAELTTVYGIDEPILLPLDDESVRVYIDNLFLEGFLKPESLDRFKFKPEKLPKNIWIRAGLKLNPERDRQERLQRLIENLHKEVPAEGDRYQSWISFAPRWAELIVLWHQIPESNRSGYQSDFSKLQQLVDQQFLDWVAHQYKRLSNEFTNQPVMLHHIPQSLSQQIAADPQTKIALLVMDGMAYDQWLVMRQVLKQQMLQLTMQESGVFAWLPTTTSVSRQSLFSGKLPMEFASSIGDTGRESKLWSTFWIDQGLMPQNVGYLKFLTNLSIVEDLLASSKLKVLGLIINQVDNIMHGMTLGTAGMHNQVKQWTQNGFLRDLCKLLLDRSFRLVITADHGNIEAIGIGNPKEGIVADKRGERVRVYPNAQLRDQTQTRYPGTIKWPSTGLPNDYHALFPPPRKAFVTAEAVSVCHGGISLEEVIVPYIQLS